MNNVALSRSCATIYNEPRVYFFPSKVQLAQGKEYAYLFLEFREHNQGLWRPFGLWPRL